MDLRAAMIANEGNADATPYARMIEGLRLAVRQCQLDLTENPDPASPWWFLVDPSADFKTSA